MRLAIIGSRTFNDYEYLKRSINDLGLEITEIVSGGAVGADTLGERYAEEFKIPIQVYRPNWKISGRSAGFKRNLEIVENCDAVLALWDGTSKGTRNTIDQATKNNKTVYVRRF